MGNAHTRKKPLFEEAVVASLGDRNWQTLDVEERMRELDEEDWKRRATQISHVCNECSNVIDKGRYHCSECRDFDLCQACIDAGLAHQHNPEHEFTHDTVLPRDVHDTLRFSPELRNDMAAILSFCLESYSDRRCFGWRDPNTQEPVWLKYRTVNYMVNNCARALDSLRRQVAKKGSPQQEEDLTQSQFVMDSPDFVISICGNNRPEWMIADFAAVISGHVVAPLYPTMSMPVLTEILAETESWLIFCGMDTLEKLDNEFVLPDLRVVVVFGEHGELKMRNRPAIWCISWEDFLRKGERAMEQVRFSFFSFLLFFFFCM